MVTQRGWRYLRQWIKVFMIPLALTLSIGCQGKAEKPAAPEQEEAKGEDPKPTPEETTNPVGPIGQWPDGYPALLTPNSVFVATFTPDLIALDLERAVQILNDVDAPMAERLQKTLQMGLGDLVKLLAPGGWAEQGFDPERPLMIEVVMVNANEVGTKLTTILEAKGSDEAAAALKEAREDFSAVGLGIRFSLPVIDEEKADAFINQALPSMTAEPLEPFGDYQQVFVVNKQLLVGVGKSKGVLHFDTVAFPWQELEFDALMAKTRTALEGLSNGQGERRVPGPDPKRSRGYSVVMLDPLNDLNNLSLLLRAGEAGEHFEEWLESARLADRLLGDRSAYQAMSLDLRDDGLTLSTTFRTLKPALIEALAKQPSLSYGDAIAGADFAPLVAATTGPWVDAGLTPSERIDIGRLLSSLNTGHGLLPLLVPVWSTHVPHLVWRDLVPGAARYIDPMSLERLEVVVSEETVTEDWPIALVAIDQDAKPELHQHGLACLTQRRPVQGKCRDEKIVIGEVATTKMGRREIHYIIKAEGDDVLMIVSPVKELVKRLAETEVSETSTVARLSVDAKKLSGMALGELFGEPLRIASQLITQVDAQITADETGFHWQIKFDPQVSLAELAVVAGPAIVEYVRKSKEVEAYVGLQAIAMGAAAYFDENGHYPKAPEAVCTAGGAENGARVSPLETKWGEGVWSELGFSLSHPHLFKLCYQSTPDGASFSVWAEASLSGEGLDALFCGNSLSDGGGGPLGTINRLEPGERCAP